jgi:hypothetical protein
MLRELHVLIYCYYFYLFTLPVPVFNIIVAQLGTALHTGNYDNTQIRFVATATPSLSLSLSLSVSCSLFGLLYVSQTM